MRKPVTPYTDYIDLPDDPGEAPAKPVQAGERMAVQSYEHTDARRDDPAPVQDAVSTAPADKRAKGKPISGGIAPLRFDPEYVKELVEAGYMTPEEAASAPLVEAEPVAEPEAEKPVKVSPPRGDTRARPRATKDATRQTRPAGVPSRREAARLRREAPKVEPADYDQRSLYARGETFERFRKLAFERRTTMQALYREGLLLVLEKYGAAEGMGPDDV